MSEAWHEKTTPLQSPQRGSSASQTVALTTVCPLPLGSQVPSAPPTPAPPRPAENPPGGADIALNWLPEVGGGHLDVSQLDATPTCPPPRVLSSAMRMSMAHTGSDSTSHQINSGPASPRLGPPRLGASPSPTPHLPTPHPGLQGALLQVVLPVRQPHPTDPKDCLSWDAPGRVMRLEGSPR